MPALPRFPNRLADLLVERGLTQTDLCTLSGLSRQTINNAYHGRDNVGLESWIRMAKALGVPLAAIAPADDVAAVSSVF